MAASFCIDSWPVFHEDNHLFVLYKPAGLLVQADRTGDPSLFELARAWIRDRYEKPGRVYLGLVHRLDRPVAGVVLFARTSKAAARLSEQFRSAAVEKGYTAVVEGRIRQPAGRLVHFLERTGGPSSRIVNQPTPGSREARLSFSVLDTHKNQSLVSIDLETGRHHQIRAQFARIGHPVLGDLRYGAKSPLPGKPIALLASSLSVLHPTSKEPLSFSSPFPAGWPWPGTGRETGAPPWNWSEICNREFLI